MCKGLDQSKNKNIVQYRPKAVTINAHCFTFLYQISYWSTSPDLSNTDRFPYFYRAVPSDQYQAQAMIDIVLHFNWSYVSIVYENSNYGVQGIEEVKKLAMANDVCVAVKEMIPRDGNESVYDRIIMNLQKATDAKGNDFWITETALNINALLYLSCIFVTVLCGVHAPFCCQ